MVNNVTIESGERQVMYGVEIMRVGLFTTINFRYHNLTIMWDGGESAARGRHDNERLRILGGSVIT